MIFTPRPWQPPMMEHIARHPRCAAFAAMGSGKTGATLHALRAMDLMEEGPGLIIGPLRVARDVWTAETEKWSSLAGIEITPIIGTQTQRFTALSKKTLWHSVNYEMLPWLVKHHGRNWPYRTIVADESTRLKGMREAGQGGERTNALAKVAWMPAVKRFIELTGTPAPNGLKDLWGQLWYLDHGERLGRSFTAFKDRWFGRPHSGYGLEPFPFSQDQIQDKIADLCITIDPKDYGVDVGKPIETDVVVHLPDKALDLYRKMEKQMFFELEHDFGAHEVEAVNAAARTNKCLQIASGFVYHEGGEGLTELHDAKLQALDSIREEANGMPLLISYSFVHELEMLKRHFPQLRAIKDVDLKEWNAGRIPMMAAHPASAGHGLNLQEGSNILVDFSSGWDLEYDDQIIERIGPMRQYQSGLNRAVHRYRIMAHGTVDYLVKRRRETKRTVQDILLEAMKRRS